LGPKEPSKNKLVLKTQRPMLVGV